MNTFKSIFKIKSTALKKMSKRTGYLTKEGISMTNYNQKNSSISLVIRECKLNSQ